MAPPRHRRPGFSRRAQYGLFASYVVAVAGVFVGLGLIIVARLDPQGFASLRGVATDITAPVTSVGRAAVRRIGAFGDGVAAYFNAAAQNRALRTEMEDARTRLVEARAIEHENRRLKRILKLKETTPEIVIIARIVGSTASSTRRLATLTAGASDGVRPGQPVRAPEGLVGRVTETGRGSSRILLLTDSGNTVPIRLARSGVPALATGRGDGTIELRALIAGTTPFQRGDIAITSGTGGVYPPNIPVAVVTKINGDIASAWPLADPAKLDFAAVIKTFQADLPPLPTTPATR